MHQWSKLSAMSRVGSAGAQPSAHAAQRGRGRGAGRARTPLQAARWRRGWTQQQVMNAYEHIAEELGVSVVSSASLKTQLSRWENGHETPTDPDHRRIFRTMYGLTDAELGFTADLAAQADPLDQARDALAGRLLRAERVDTAVIDLLAAQTHQLRLLDRRFGAATILDQMNGHVATITQLLAHSTRERDRVALAEVLADAGALAGWQALDAGAIQRSWEHFATARAAAREADRPELLAHALGEQAYALLDLGRTVNATQLVDHATSIRGLPSLLRAWLAAAKGEMLAATNDEAASLRAFDAAHALLPDDAHDGALPFLALDEVHLARWRGNALARLGRREAVDELTDALTRLDPAFVRAACVMHADLATAYAAAGEREQARTEARIARGLAIELRSERIRQRLETLRLPHPAQGQ